MLSPNTSNISNNTFKLSNITYSELSSSGNYGINGGDNGGISSVYPNGSINITGGYDGVNVNGIIVIKQDNAERIKITDDDTTFGSSTNKMLTDPKIKIWIWIHPCRDEIVYLQFLELHFL